MQVYRKKKHKTHENYLANIEYEGFEANVIALIPTSPFQQQSHNEFFNPPTKINSTSFKMKKQGWEGYWLLWNYTDKDLTLANFSTEHTDMQTFSLGLSNLLKLTQF